VKELVVTVPGTPGAPWQYPDSRYYYDWYGETGHPPQSGISGGYQQQGHSQQPDQAGAQTDSAIKSEVVDRLRANTYTADSTLSVQVHVGVVVLAGDVPSVLAKRAAGDDCWDTPGVVDVSNQLTVVPAA
jgi:osmotically-inducible protein OsmY